MLDWKCGHGGPSPSLHPAAVSWVSPQALALARGSPGSVGVELAGHMQTRNHLHPGLAVSLVLGNPITATAWPLGDEGRVAQASVSPAGQPAPEHEGGISAPQDSDLPRARGRRSHASPAARPAHTRGPGAQLMPKLPDRGGLLSSNRCPRKPLLHVPTETRSRETVEPKTRDKKGFLPANPGNGVWGLGIVRHQAHI